MLNPESKLSEFNPMDDPEAQAIRNQIDQLEREKAIFRSDGQDCDLAGHHQIGEWNKEIRKLELRLVELQGRYRP